MQLTSTTFTTKYPRSERLYKYEGGRPQHLIKKDSCEVQAEIKSPVCTILVLNSLYLSINTSWSAPVLALSALGHWNKKHITVLLYPGISAAQS